MVLSSLEPVLGDLIVRDLVEFEFDLLALAPGAGLILGKKAV